MIRKKSKLIWGKENMKRKISNICLLLIILLIPIYVLADTCTTPSISGNASSSNGSSKGAGGCSSPHCHSVFTDDAGNVKYVGIRFQIYKYDNSGKATGINLVGKGVDVWATDDLKKGYYSSPSTANLRIKSLCTDTNNSKYDHDGHVDTHPLNLKQYADTKQVRFDTSLGARFNKGTVNSYILTHNGNKPTGGWFATNLLNKLISGKKKEIDEVKELFGLNDTQINDLMNNIDNYYITAEVLYRYRTNKKNGCVNYGGQCDEYRTALNKYPDTYFSGTVSENAVDHGNKNIYDSLYISDGKTSTANPDVGKIVGSKYFIKKVGKIAQHNFSDYIEGWNKNAKESACNYARGYAVWNIGTICWECGYTCESSCSYTTSGTQERAACATSWCSTNQPDNKQKCINSCTNVPADEGCSSTEKKCSDYQSNSSNVVKKEGTCDDTITEANKNGKSDSVTAKICYDDNKSFNDSNDLETYTNTKYYKIICEETMNLTNLPNKPTLYLTEGKSGNVHFSYALTYNKKCNLYFKTNKAYKDLKAENAHKHWFIPKSDDEYTKYTKVYEDIRGLSSAITKANAELDKLRKAKTLDPSDERILKNITIQENAVKNYQNTISTLKKIKGKAKNRLSVLINEKTPEQLKANEVKLKTYKYKKSSEYQDIKIDLIPLTCTPNVGSNTSKSTYLCLLNGIDVQGTQTITINGIDYTCNGTGGTISNKNNGNTQYYDEVIVYSVPDSYISAHTNTSGSVFHSEKECEDNVKAANGFCKIVEYGYTFPEFDGDNLKEYIETINNIPDKLTLSLAGGLCDELSYDYKCDYKVKGEYCDECKEFAEGSAEYIACYQEKCSCDAYCGSNQVCRAKYCPEICEGCNWQQVQSNCTDCEKTCGKYSNKDSVEYKTCFYDECCTSQCDGSCSCAYNCCTDKCNALYSGNETKLSECTAICTRDLKSCNEGSGYLYRNISLNNPFPERGTSTGNIGNNWYGKENYITNTDETNYRDETDGRSDKYEYSIEINSKQLKQLKNEIKKNKTADETGYKDSTSYKSFGSSVNYTSIIDSRAYCSKFLHEDLISIINESSYHETADATMNCRTN